MQNPLRSEAAAFRLLVAFFLFALPVIVVGLLFGPTAGVIVLLVEIGVVIGVAISIYRRARE